MAFTPASIGTPAENLDVAQHNLGFSQRKLAEFQSLLQNETDPTLIKQYTEEVAGYQQDIIEYQEKVTGYTDLIQQKQVEAATANTGKDSPGGATTTVSASETTTKENPNQGTNPSGEPGANTSQEPGGQTVQTFDDGSTLTTNADGTTSSTPATDGTATGPSAAQAAVDAAQSKYDVALKSAVDAETALQQAEDALDIAQNADPADPQAIDDAQNQIDAARRALDTAQNDVSNADKELTDALTSLDNPSGGESVTNKSSTDLSGGIGSMDSLSALKNRAGAALGAVGGYAGNGLKALGRGIGLSGSSSSRGALNSMPSKPAAATAGFGSSQDMRVKLRVPPSYLVGPGAGPDGILTKLGGILWPYTPQVSVNSAAAYAQNKVTHSNYNFYNYQSSSVGPISVSGKFTAQNEAEAAIILSVQHVLRALIKMKWGDDTNAGAPPPICRLDAFGDSQFKNIPCAVADFKVELPDGVDYIAVGRASNLKGWGNTMVPTSCTISVTLNIMYSRQEMMNYSVDKWLQGALAGKGYL
jgi:hypothetical protein